MALTDAQAEAVLSRLDAIHAEVREHIKSQSYAIFSGQPEQNLGALENAYNVTISALRRDKQKNVDGVQDAFRKWGWLDAAKDCEQSMRAISGYSDGASATTGIIDTLTPHLPDLPDLHLPGLPSFKLPYSVVIVLTLVVVGAIVMAIAYVWRAFK